VLPPGWHRCRSSAIAAYRYLEEEQRLELLFVEGRLVYEYPCPPDLFERFLAAPSKGRFHHDVLQPYARARDWSPRPRHWPRGEPIDWR
jgi:KTSC domain